MMSSLEVSGAVESRRTPCNPGRALPALDDVPDRAWMPAPPAVASRHAGRVEAVGDRPESEATGPSLRIRARSCTFRTGGLPSCTPLSLPNGQGRLGPLTDEAALQLGEHRDQLGHRLASGGGEVDAQVEGDEVPPLALCPLDGLGGVDDRAREAVEPGHGQSAGLLAVDGLEGCPQARLVS